MTLPDHFRQALMDVDVPLARKIMRHVNPHLPQPKTDAEALATLHVARTGIPSIPLRMRAYSHRWCLDHGYTSQLPDNLKPKAERLYPKIVHAVGIAVKSSVAGLAPLLRGVMEKAALDCYEKWGTDDEFVRERILEARAKEKQKLFGRTFSSAEESKK